MPILIKELSEVTLAGLSQYDLPGEYDEEQRKCLSEYYKANDKYLDCMDKLLGMSKEQEGYWEAVEEKNNALAEAKTRAEFARSRKVYI